MTNAPQPVEPDAKKAPRQWGRLIALGGFWFFLLKGLAWVVVAAAAWMVATD